MAQINVEPKKKNNWWMWLVVIVVILLVWWFFMRNGYQMDDTITPMIDTTRGMDDTM